MRWLTLIPFAFLVLVPTRAIAAEHDLGGPGESCRARSDCRGGLRCVAQTCVDEREGSSCQSRADCGGELACVGNRCVVSGGSPGPSPMTWRPGAAGPEVDAPSEGSRFEPSGAHPFFGLTWTGGPASLAVANDQRVVVDDTVQGSFLFALRGGVMFGRNELGVELSPGTYAWYSNTGGGTFQFNVTYAHYLPLHEGRSLSVYWPLRVGAGVFAGNTGDLAFFQGRADLFGVALRFGHLMVDLHTPSFRYGVSSSPYAAARTHGTASLHLFSWEIGTSVSYVF